MLENAGFGPYSDAPPTGSTQTGYAITPMQTVGGDLDFIDFQAYSAGPSYDPEQAFQAYRSYYAVSSFLVRLAYFYPGNLRCKAGGEMPWKVATRGFICPQPSALCTSVPVRQVRKSAYGRVAVNANAKEGLAAYQHAKQQVLKDIMPHQWSSFVDCFPAAWTLSTQSPHLGCGPGS